MIANARMYSVAPAAKTAWNHLLAWTLRRAGLDWEVMEHAAPAPMAKLWARDDLGCAFMCGWPYTRNCAKYILLAAPVPAPPRYGARPVYFTDLVVSAGSPHHKLADTFGGSLAYTLEDSQSGYNAVRHHLLAYRSPSRRSLYASLTGPLITPRRVLQAVADGTATIGPLDSYAHDLLRRHEPELAAQVRTVATTRATPIPPLVAAATVDQAVVVRLRAALLEVAQAPALTDAREALLLNGFAAVDASDYAILETQAREAEAAGYPGLL